MSALLPTTPAMMASTAAMMAPPRLRVRLGLGHVLVHPGHVLGQVELSLLVQIHAHNPCPGLETHDPGGLLRLPGISWLSARWLRAR
jgi:hypothetical protein